MKTFVIAEIGINHNGDLKTALELIKEYGDIDGLLKNAKNIKQEKRRQAILESEKDIRTSLELVKLKDNIELPINIEEIKSYSIIKKQNQKLFDFLNL